LLLFRPLWLQSTSSLSHLLAGFLSITRKWTLRFIILVSLARSIAISYSSFYRPMPWCLIDWSGVVNASAFHSEPVLLSLCLRFLLGSRTHKRATTCNSIRADANLSLASEFLEVAIRNITTAKGMVCTSTSGILLQKSPL